MKIIITESQYSFLMKEQMGYYPGYGELAAAGAKGIAKSISQGAYDITKKALFGGKNFTLDEFVEKIREYSGSPAGILLTIMLDQEKTYGNKIVLLFYALLLSYDIKKAIEGKPDYLNIIFDLVSLYGAIGGIGTQEVLPLLKVPKSTASQTLAGTINLLEKKYPKMAEFISPIIPKLQQFITIIEKWLVDAAGWVKKTFGWKTLEEDIKIVGTKVKDFVKELISSNNEDYAQDKYEKNIKKGMNPTIAVAQGVFDRYNPNLAQRTLARIKYN